MYDVDRLINRIMEGEVIISSHSLEKNINDNEIYYFADKLYQYGMHDDAIKYYEQFLQQDSQDVDRKIATLRQIGSSYLIKGDYEQCRKYCFKAFELGLPRGEQCYLLGQTYHYENKYDEAIFWYDLATRCKVPETHSPYAQEEDWTINPFLQQCLCYYAKEDLENAFLSNEKAAKFNKDHDKIKYNREFFISKGFTIDEE